MFPSDDDEFEGDAVAIIPVSGTRLPGPVFVRARQWLSQMILSGDGEVHGAFRLQFGNSVWTATPRQESSGLYKLIFEEAAGCKDRLPFVFAARWAETEDPPIAYVAEWDEAGMETDITVEEIDEPVVTPSTKNTKGWRRPTWMKGTYDDMAEVGGTFTPGAPLFPFDYRFHQASPERRFFWYPFDNNSGATFPQLEWMRTGHWRPAASAFTGQMRHMVQSLYARRKTDNDIPIKGLSGALEVGAHGFNMVAYGIVEYPHPRVVGATAAEEEGNARARKFYLVEISQHGVFYTKLSIKQPWLACSWAESMPRALKTQYMWQIYTDGEDRWKRVFTDTEMEAVYDEGCIPHPHANWAFSYSGHQASVIVTRQVDFGSGSAPVITRFSMDFTVNEPDPPDEPRHYLTAVINEEEQQTLTSSDTGAVFFWPCAMLAGFPLGGGGDFYAVPQDTEDYDLMIDKFDDHGLVFNPDDSTLFFSMPFCRDDSAVATFSHSQGTFDIPVHLWYWGDDLVVVRRFAVADVNGVSVIGGPFNYTSGTMDTDNEPVTYGGVAMPWYDRESVVLCGPAGTDVFTQLFLRGEDFGVNTLTTASTPTDSSIRLMGGALSTFAMGGGLFYDDETLSPPDQQDNALVMPIAQPRGVGSGYTNPTHSGTVDLAHTIFRESLEGRGIFVNLDWADYDEPLTLVGRC